MKTLVTGHRGFVGLHLCNELRMMGHDVFGLDKVDGNDIRYCELPDADRVFHLAAQTDAQNPDAISDAATNIHGLLRVLDKYRDRVVFASSSMVNYPVTPYAISKRAGEEYVKTYGGAVVRFCNLYGPGGHSAMDRFREDEVISIRGDGSQLRTYAHIHAAVYYLVTAKPGSFRILPGAEMTVAQIADLFPDKRRKYLPNKLTDIKDGRQIFPPDAGFRSRLLLPVAE